MNRYRLISSIVVMYVYLLVMFPVQTIFVSVILAAAYFIYRDKAGSDLEQNSKRKLREAALRAASIYLAPYTNIWTNLKLSNKYCSMRLSSYGGSITARDARDSSKYFKVIDSKVHSYDNLWNMFCLNFTYNTTFEELVQLANRFEAVIQITDVQKTILGNEQCNTQKYTQNNINISQSNLPQSDLPRKKELLDVNNASEVELTALPGVSIVMAKKLIKRREEIGGFKSVNDVCVFLKMKPHMQSQLEQLICVKKMKGSIKINRNSERSVDI